MEEDRKILINQIRTPDGTILISRHRHDYVTYTDKNGLEYMVDGGTAYLRRNVHKTKYTIWNNFFKIFKKNKKDPLDYEEISIYKGDEIDFEVLRTKLCRGGRGKDGRQPLTWIPVSEMNDNWLENVIAYEEERRPDNDHLIYYRKEIQYRKYNNISIKED